MKRYRLKQNLPGQPAGTFITGEPDNIWYPRRIFISDTDWFEEVKEEEPVEWNCHIKMKDSWSFCPICAAPRPNKEEKLASIYCDCGGEPGELRWGKFVYGKFFHSQCEKIFPRPTEEKKICKHCHGDLSIRNPKTFCDHLRYPENCRVCLEDACKKEKKEEECEHHWVGDALHITHCKKCNKPPGVNNNIFKPLALKPDPKPTLDPEELAKVLYAAYWKGDEAIVRANTSKYWIETAQAAIAWFKERGDR